jgi:hypothetical protein
VQEEPAVQRQQGRVDVRAEAITFQLLTREYFATFTATGGHVLELVWMDVAAMAVSPSAAMPSR